MTMALLTVLRLHCQSAIWPTEAESAGATVPTRASKSYYRAKIVQNPIPRKYRQNFMWKVCGIACIGRA